MVVKLSLVVKMELMLCIVHTFALFLFEYELENCLKFSSCRKVSQAQVDRNRQCTIRLTFAFISFPEAKYENFPDFLLLTFSVQVHLWDCEVLAHISAYSS